MINVIYSNSSDKEESAGAGKKRDVFNLPFEYQEYLRLPQRSVDVRKVIILEGRLLKSMEYLQMDFSHRVRFSQVDIFSKKMLVIERSLQNPSLYKCQNARWDSG